MAAPTQLQLQTQWCSQDLFLYPAGTWTLQTQHKDAQPHQQNCCKDLSTETGSLLHHPITGLDISGKHGVLARLSLVVWCTHIISLGADNCFTHLPHLELLVPSSAQRQGGGSGEEGCPPPRPQELRPTGCRERALTQPGDRARHTGLQLGTGPQRRPSAC